MIHRLDITGNDSLSKYCRHKVDNKDWKVEDGFEVFRDDVPCFTTPLSVGWHIAHGARESVDGWFMHHVSSPEFVKEYDLNLDDWTSQTHRP